MKIYKCKIWKRGGTEESEDVPFEHIEDFNVVVNPSNYTERTQGIELQQDEPINFPNIGELRMTTTELDVMEVSYFKVVDEVSNTILYYHFQSYSVMVNADQAGGLIYTVQYILDMGMTHQNKRYKNLIRNDIGNNGVEMNVINCHSNRGYNDPITKFSEFNYIKYPQLRTLNTAIQTTAETIKEPVNAYVLDDEDYEYELDLPMHFNVSINMGQKDTVSSHYQGSVAVNLNGRKEVYNDSDSDSDKVGFKYELDYNLQPVEYTDPSDYHSDKYECTFAYTNKVTGVVVNSEFLFCSCQRPFTPPTWRQYDDFFKNDDGNGTYAVIPSSYLTGIADGYLDATKTGFLEGSKCIYNNEQMTGGFDYYLGVPIQNSKPLPDAKYNEVIRKGKENGARGNGKHDQVDETLKVPSKDISGRYEVYSILYDQTQYDFYYKQKNETENKFVDTGECFREVFKNYSGKELTNSGNQGSNAYTVVKMPIPPSMLCGMNGINSYKIKGDDRKYAYPVFINQSMVEPLTNIGITAVSDQMSDKGAATYHGATNTCIICDFASPPDYELKTDNTFFKKGQKLINEFFKKGNKTPTVPEFEPLLMNEGYLSTQLSLKKTGQGQLHGSLLDMIGFSQIETIDYQFITTDLTYYKGDLPEKVFAPDSQTIVDVLCNDYPISACQEELLFQDDRTMPTLTEAYTNYLNQNSTTMNTSRAMANISARQDIMNGLVNMGVSTYSGTNLLKSSVLAANATANAEINYNKEQRQIDSQVANIMNSPGVLSIPPFIGSMFNTGKIQGYTSYLSPKSEKQVFNYFAGYGYIQNTIINSKDLGNREKFNYVKIDPTYNSQKIIEYTNNGISNLFQPYEYAKNFNDRLAAGIRVHKGGLGSVDIPDNYENEAPNFNIVKESGIKTSNNISESFFEQGNYPNVEFNLGVDTTAEVNGQVHAMMINRCDGQIKIYYDTNLINTINTIDHPIAVGGFYNDLGDLSAQTNITNTISYRYLDSDGNIDVVNKVDIIIVEICVGPAGGSEVVDFIILNDDGSINTRIPLQSSYMYPCITTPDLPNIYSFLNRYLQISHELTGGTNIDRLIPLNTSQRSKKFQLYLKDIDGNEKTIDGTLVEDIPDDVFYIEFKGVYSQDSNVNATFNVYISETA